jgi:FkbM family methyltransferase
MMDAVGVRQGLVRSREWLVDALSGNSASPTERRNRIDDRHLRLLLRFGMRPSSNFLDVGANRGKFLTGVERLAPLGHHVAYEPLPHFFADLVRRFPEVEIRQSALSDRDGEFEFVHVLDSGYQGYSGLADEGSSGRSGLDGVATETLTVKTERLDGRLDDGWLPDFVKIDVEGAEVAVVRGAVETFRRAEPVIAFEHAWQGDESRELYALVCDDIGLRLFDMDGNGPLERSQFFEALETRWNWVAHL